MLSVQLKLGNLNQPKNCVTDHVLIRYGNHGTNHQSVPIYSVQYFTVNALNQILSCSYFTVESLFFSNVPTLNILTLFFEWSGIEKSIQQEKIYNYWKETVFEFFFLFEQQMTCRIFFVTSYNWAGFEFYSKALVLRLRKEEELLLQKNQIEQ